MKLTLPMLLSLSLLAFTAQAHDGHDHGKEMETPQAQSPLADEWTAGEVRKVDRAQGKVTLKHDFIRNLGMDAMTMVFRVRDPHLLAGLEVGQSIRFKATEATGILYLVDWQIQP